MKLSGVEEFNDKFKHLQERAKRLAEARAAVAISLAVPETDGLSRTELPPIPLAAAHGSV